MPATRQPEKRARSSATDETAAHKPKRGKYTPVACNECKRRKLKCAPGDNSGRCGRCASVGLRCQYTPTRRDNAENRKDNTEQSHVVNALINDVKELRAMMGDLLGSVGDLTTRLDSDGERPSQHDSMAPRSVSRRSATKNAAAPQLADSGEDGRTASLPPAELPTVRRRGAIPEQPCFVGPTRSAYSIQIGERSLTQMGIPRFEQLPASVPPSRVGSPKLHSATATLDEAFWQRCDAHEVARLLSVFQEEVESVYPCIDTDYLVVWAGDLLTWGRFREEIPMTDVDPKSEAVTFKDFQLAKVAIATAIVIEAHGKNENSTLMVESVERRVSRIMKPTCDLKDLQLLAILSIYYFHCDEDLLAWRTIGLAAREALVMGLHRKSTLLETFSDEKMRALAVRVFWSIYVLDRRWSFGTSLPFALVDRDIDPELPEPGPEYQYLQCMLGYGRHCSSLWDALMLSGSLSNYIPEETTTMLDLKTQEWLESIPMHLQLRHPRLGLAARAQPRVLQRLRALLYLRGNHTRILIYRHHLLSPYRIKSEPRKAWLVVEIAQDSIQVLMHLNSTSDIYRRQQSAFNYFLISSLAVIFLAVCHDPGTFSEPCRRAFHGAVKLVRDFSRHSQASHRLWGSIKGLLPRLCRLGLRDVGDGRESMEGSRNNETENGETALSQLEIVQNDPPAEARSPILGQSTTQRPVYVGHPGQGPAEMATSPLDTQLVDGSMDAQADLNTTPNLFQMSNDLMMLFNVFEQGQHFPSNMDQACYPTDGMYPADSIIGEDGELSRRLRWLI